MINEPCQANELALGHSRCPPTTCTHHKCLDTANDTHPIDNISEAHPIFEHATWPRHFEGGTLLRRGDTREHCALRQAPKFREKR